MTIQKKSLISSLNTTKKAIVASTPAVQGPRLAKGTGRVELAKKLAKGTGRVELAKKLAKGTGRVELAKAMTKTIL